jgi:hypothetical protein
MTQQQQQQQQQQQGEVCGSSQCNGSSCNGSSSSKPLPLLQQLMPHLQAVVAITTGSHSKFVHRLQQLISPGTAIITPFYGTTEGLYGYPAQLLVPGPWDFSEHPGKQQYVLLPDATCFFEFIPAASADGVTSSSIPVKEIDAGNCSNSTQQQQPQQGEEGVLTMEQLQVGCSYKLVVTNFLGLLRYRIGDVVKVTGFMRYDVSSRHQAAAEAPGQQVAAAPAVLFERRAGVALNLVW